MATSIQTAERVEILTLQDNYIDLVSRDDTDVVTRARPVKGQEIRNSILAEHGFAALVTVTRGGVSRTVLFDGGFSETGAALNAETLSADLTRVEAVVVSHGHLDHVGGIGELLRRVGKRGIPLVTHPAAFRSPRYIKLHGGVKLYFPAFSKEKAMTAGAAFVETRSPYPLLDGGLLFLGEVPRTTAFETGAPYLCYEEGGEERQDLIEDDTAVVAHVRGRGLVVLSGCAHAGIVNTVKHAQEVTGVRQVFAVMGGFHLTGADMRSVVEPTARALVEIAPEHIVPTHCTGRQASLEIERMMPGRFLLNMAGTKITFAAASP